MNNRITDKRNVFLNGEKKTSFVLHSYNKEKECYLFQGNYFADGWDATDMKCGLEAMVSEDEFINY